MAMLAILPACLSVCKIRHMKQQTSNDDTIRLGAIYRALAAMDGAEVDALAAQTGIGRSTLYQYRSSPDALKRARGSTLLKLQRALRGADAT